MRDVKEMLTLWRDSEGGPEAVLSVFCMEMCEVKCAQDNIRTTLGEMQDTLLVQQAFDARQRGAASLIDKIVGIVVPLCAAVVGGVVVLIVH